MMLLLLFYFSTEAVIHYTLDSKFPHKTVIVIARQVHTVISLDRVMVRNVKLGYGMPHSISIYP